MAEVPMISEMSILKCADWLMLECIACVVFSRQYLMSVASGEDTGAVSYQF